MLQVRNLQRPFPSFPQNTNKTRINKVVDDVPTARKRGANTDRNPTEYLDKGAH